MRSFLTLLLGLILVHPLSAAQPSKLPKRPVEPLPAYAVARLGSALWLHQWSHGTLVFTPTKPTTVLAVAGFGSGIGIWDAATGTRLHHWEAAPHFSLLRNTVLSANRQVLASVGGDQDRTITVCDISTGAVRKTWKAPERIYGVALSADGSLLATATWEESVRLWDTATGTEQRVFPGAGRVLLFGANKDNNTLFIGNEKNVAIWDVKGKELRRLEGGASALVISRDGAVLAASPPESAKLQAIRIWDPSTGEKIQTIELETKERSDNILAISADGGSIAFADHELLRVWEAFTGKERFKKRGAYWSGSVALSADGGILVWKGMSKVHQWDFRLRREVTEAPGHDSTVYSLVFSPDGKRLVSRGAEDIIHIWNRFDDRFNLFHSIPSSDENAAIGWKVVYSPNGRLLATRSRTQIRLLDADTGQVRHVFQGNPSGVEVVFSPNGKLLAIDESVSGEDGNLYGRIHIWDIAAEKRLRTIERNLGDMGRFAFSHDSKMLATCGDAVRLWDVTTGTQARRFPAEASTVAFTPDGETLIAAGESVTVWELGTGKHVSNWKVGGRIQTLALSPDGMTLAVAHQDRLSLWSVGAAKELAQLAGHKSWVQSLAFSPDGERLASGSDDTTILVWNVIAAINAVKAKQAPAPTDLETLWDDLGKADARVGYFAIQQMIAQPERTLRFLKDRLQPPDKEDAAELKVPAGDPLRRLRAIEVLEVIGTNESKAILSKLSKGPPTRFTREVQAALARLERTQPIPIKPRSEPEPKGELEQAWKELGEADAVLGFRAIKTLVSEPNEAIALLKSRLKPAKEEKQEAPVLVPPGDPLRAFRAVEVLEQIGSAEAREVLETLAKGPPARLTREAQAALKRLEQRTKEQP